jgi:hypothetical protein
MRGNAHYPHLVDPVSPTPNFLVASSPSARCGNTCSAPPGLRWYRGTSGLYGNRTPRTGPTVHTECPMGATNTLLHCRAREPVTAGSHWGHRAAWSYQATTCDHHAGTTRRGCADLIISGRRLRIPEATAGDQACRCSWCDRYRQSSSSKGNRSDRIAASSRWAVGCWCFPASRLPAWWNRFRDGRVIGLTSVTSEASSRSSAWTSEASSRSSACPAERNNPPSWLCGST